MNPARTPKRRKPTKAAVTWQMHSLGASLRTLLQQVEIRIGLLPRPDGFEQANRFQGATLLPTHDPTPAELRSLFPEELAELLRLGKSVELCHKRDLGVCRVLCLPYFSFDGFNALLAVEQDGAILAAWKDMEALQGFSPQTLHARIEFAALEGLLLDALQRPA